MPEAFQELIQALHEKAGLINYDDSGIRRLIFSNRDPSNKQLRAHRR